MWLACLQLELREHHSHRYDPEHHCATDHDYEHDRYAPLRRGRDAGTVTVAVEEARRLALALPGAVEQDHHGRPSFRVRGRIFATIWDAEHMNVMLDESGIKTAVQANSSTCAERWWGRRLAAVSVDLRSAEPELLGELLADAWEHRCA